MNTFSKTKFILATLASGMVMFMLAGLWNSIVFPQLGIVFPEGLLREMPIFPLIILGYLILGTMVVYIGSKSNFSANNRMHWFITGALVMEIAFGFSSIVLQANYNLVIKAIPYDLLWYIVEGGAGGLVVSFFTRKHL